MKKLFTIGVLVILSLGVSLQAQVSLTNGDMEAWTLGTPSGLGTWTFNGAYVELGSTDANGGNYALSLPPTADVPLTTDYISQPLGPEAGGPPIPVRVDIWAKGSGAPESIRIGVWDIGAGAFLPIDATSPPPGLGPGPGPNVIPVSGVYTMYTAIFTTTGTGNPHELRISADASVVIDDVVLTPGPHGFTPVINGDFETWTTTPATLGSWSVVSYSTAELTQSGTANGGSFSASMTAGDIANSGKYLYQSIGTPSGTVEIDVSFWTYRTAGTEGIQFGIHDGSSFIVSDEYEHTASSAWEQHTFSFSGTAASTYEIRFAGGVGTTVLLDDVTVAENAAPTASTLAIAGTIETGFTLTASYTYADGEGDLEGSSTIQWYTATTTTGTVGKTAISGATSTTYTLTAAENGLHIGFEVIPVALTGTSPGALTAIASYVGPVVVNVAPTFASAAIDPATYKLGVTLTTTIGVYGDVDGDLAGAHTYQWYTADDGSGTNKTAISGATTTSFTLTSAEVGKWIGFGATPVALTGVSPGAEVMSSYVGAVTGLDLLFPTLTAPSNGATNQSLTPTFSWTVGGGTDEEFFILELATDATFTNIIHTETDVIGTTSYPYAGAALSLSTTYYWRVRHSNTSIGGGPYYSPWSTIWSFTTTAVTTPVIVYPTGGGTIYTDSPTIYWYAATYAPSATFTLEVDNDGAGFPSPDTYSGLTTTYKALTGLTAGATYHIRVTMVQGPITAVSATESFVVDATVGALGVPTPSYPTGGITIYTLTPTLYWYLSSGSGGSYDVDVSLSTDPTFASPVYSVTGITDLYTTVSPALLASTDYIWRVKVSASSTWSSTASFSTSAGAGGSVVVPTPSWPIGSPTVYTTTVGLYWYLGTYATGLTFEVQVDGTDNTFGNIVYTTVGSPSANYYATTTALTEGATYWWRVRSYNGSTYSAWSTAYDFTVYTSSGGGGGMETPVLTYPTGGTTVVSTSPTFYWYTVGDTGYEYDIKISRYSDLSLPVVDLSGGSRLTSATYTASGLTNGVTYYWAVRAYNTTTTTFSAWSTTASFATPVSLSSPSIVPNPGSPVAGVTVDQNAEMSWFITAPVEGLKYDLQISDNKEFTEASTFQLSDLTEKRFSLGTSNLDFEAGKEYYWRVRSKNSAGDVSYYSESAQFNIDGVTDVEDLGIIPDKFDVAQNYPNPFNPETRIRYSIAESDFVTIKIYNMLGQEVNTLLSREMNPGVYNIRWNGTDNYGNKVSSGTYFYRIVSGNNIMTKKMVLLK